MIPETFETLTPNMKFNEYIMTSLRTKWGISKARVSEMGSMYSTHLEKYVKCHIQHELMTENENNFQLTRKGKYFADRIAMELFIET